MYIQKWIGCIIRPQNISVYKDVCMLQKTFKTTKNVHSSPQTYFKTEKRMHASKNVPNCSKLSTRIFQDVHMLASYPTYNIICMLQKNLQNHLITLCRNIPRQKSICRLQKMQASKNVQNHAPSRLATLINS